MPEGQFTGSRAKYEYTADDERIYILTLDETLGDIAGAGLTKVGAGGASAGAQSKPSRFEPRGVYWQATATGFEGRRKFLTCASDSALYTATAGQALTIDGVAGVTTGRRGEQLTY